MWLPSGRKYLSKSQPLPILTLISTQRKLPIKVIVRQLLSNFFNLIVECEWIWLKRRLIWLILFIVNPVNRYPWVRRVQSSSRLVWPAYGAFDHWYQNQNSESAVGIEGSTVHEPPIQPTIDESTIEGPTPQAVEEVDQPLTFQIMESASERGKRKLIDSNGFSYNVKRQRLEATDWQCTVRLTVRCFCHLKGLGHGI